MTNSDNSTPKRPGKRQKRFDVPVGDDLYEQANDYAKTHGVPLSAVIRAILAWWTNPEDPRPLPPGIKAQVKRAKGGGRKKRTPAGDPTPDSTPDDTDA